MNIIVAGSTGLCGGAFVKKAIETSLVDKVWSFSRRDPKFTPSEKLQLEVESDSSKWGAKFPTNADVFISGVATTRAQAGGVDKQRLIDHDLQVKLASEAKAKGCKTVVIVSSSGANTSSFFAYLRMKGEVEQDIEKLGFERTIILRPGMLLGDRDQPHTGAGSGFISSMGPYFHRSLLSPVFAHPIYGSEIADSLFQLLQTLPNGVHHISSKEMLNLARNSA